jgi:type I restriction enzyme, S subunit
LDDRIDLLRHTNATLEAIAQALFKSWFVDFDPVRAKMEGRASEVMDDATTALFPSGFEMSALGEIPAAWHAGSVGAYAEQVKGTVNPPGSPTTLFAHFSLPAFDRGQMPIAEPGSAIKSNKTPVPLDSVLLSKLNPHIPRVWLPTDVHRDAVCSTEFLVFRPTPNASREYVYCSFTTDQFKKLLCQLVTGTSNSHQRVRPESVLRMSAVVPSAKVMKAFGDLVNPFFARIGRNRMQAQTLASLRDTLLPRLVSGQLRVPDTEALATATP